MATPSRNFFSAPPDAAPLLRLEDLSVHFPFEGRLLPAVRDVHLEPKDAYGEPNPAMMMHAKVGQKLYVFMGNRPVPVTIK